MASKAAKEFAATNEKTRRKSKLLPYKEDIEYLFDEEVQLRSMQRYLEQCGLSVSVGAIFYFIKKHIKGEVVDKGETPKARQAPSETEPVQKSNVEVEPMSFGFYGADEDEPATKNRLTEEEYQRLSKKWGVTKETFDIRKNSRLGSKKQTWISSISRNKRWREDRYEIVEACNVNAKTEEEKEEVWLIFDYIFQKNIDAENAKLHTY